MSLIATNNRKHTLVPQLYPQKYPKNKFFGENDPEKVLVSYIVPNIVLNVSEIKNQGLKGPKRDALHPKAKTETKTLKPNLEIKTWFS